MDFLRGHFSPLTHNLFSSEKPPVAKPNLSDEDHTVVAFVQKNWKNIVTAFLLYMFAASTFTKLKGRELIAFSSVAAVWTVFQGFSAWSLAATAPIIFGIAKVIFNWATSGNSTPAQRQYQDPVFPAHQAERRDRNTEDASPQQRDPNSSHLSEQDMRTFEAAWNDAQHTLSQPGAIKKPDSVSISVDQSHQEEGTTSTHTSPRSTDRQPTVVASPIGVATVIPVPTSVSLQQDKDMDEAWDRVSETEERDSLLPNTKVEEDEVVDTTAQKQDLRSFEEALKSAQHTVSQPGAIKKPDSVSVVIDQRRQEEVDTTSTHTSPRSTDRQPTVVASPIGVATAILVPTSANLQEVTEETSSQVSEAEERSGRQTPPLHHPIDHKEGLSDSQLELDPPLPNTKVEEDEVMDTTAKKQVKEKGEASDRAITEQKLREARRIVWQFAQIANPAQVEKISRLEPESMVAELMLSRDGFFRGMEVTPEQRIALLLPSVLTEAQAKKISIGVKKLHLAATHLQPKLFEYLEVTASQKKELIGPPVQQLAKL